jgi:hypothetical protein
MMLEDSQAALLRLDSRIGWKESGKVQPVPVLPKGRLAQNTQFIDCTPRQANFA